MPLAWRRLCEATPFLGNTFARRRPNLAMPQAVNLLTFFPFFGALERSHHVLTLTLTFGQRPGTVHQLLAFQLIKGDNFWIVDHFCTCLKTIPLNKFIIPWKPTLKPSSWAYNPCFDPLWCRWSGLHDSKKKRQRHTLKERKRCCKRWLNWLFFWKKTIATDFIAKQILSLILWWLWVSVFKIRDSTKKCTKNVRKEQK